MRCQYCDTAYAFDGGEIQSIDDILQTISQYKCGYVTVTGGEPLAQPNCSILLERLCNAGYNVSLETSGALNIGVVDPRVSVILDIKTPASLESDKNLPENISKLKASDQVKFVICDRKDYEWSKAKMLQLGLPDRVDEILMSPSTPDLQPIQLAEWILKDNLEVRMQLQLHKIIWGDKPGH